MEDKVMETVQELIDAVEDAVRHDMTHNVRAYGENESMRLWSIVYDRQQHIVSVIAGESRI